MGNHRHLEVKPVGPVSCQKEKEHIEISYNVLCEQTLISPRVAGKGRQLTKPTSITASKLQDKTGGGHGQTDRHSGYCI